MGGGGFLTYDCLFREHAALDTLPYPTHTHYYTQTHTHTSHSHLEGTEDTNTAVTLRLSEALPGLLQVPQDLEEGRTENIPAMTPTAMTVTLIGVLFS